ncbi:hypothetical protein [Mucilaginibacter sp. FT3.2]|uniref:hypothetical protein n=1 Tax=Mucilaginibacter sp. FT3.2 TaxID=2723090 RepID=UPI00160766BC|nr:hypothetical protein [Mucilaginibacter sp. FT3.2]MBB6230792.1 hypothetical protein [Mucilaginibacter sp. FT3.2]
MNIDDLKDAWNNNEPKGMQLPDSRVITGKTTSVIDKVRSNMKSEFIATIAAYPVIIAFLIFSHQTPFFFNIASVLLFTVMILNAYFYFRFYTFYKSTGRYNFSVKESIRKITYELELNTEIYKAYNFCVVPLAIILTITLFCGKSVSGYAQHILASDSISVKSMLFIFLNILCSFAITFAITNYYIKSLYGKHIAELKQIIDDLGSED